MLSDCQVHSYSECCNAPLLGLSDNNSDSYSRTGQSEEKEKQQKQTKKASRIILLFYRVLCLHTDILQKYFKICKQGQCFFFKFIDWKEGG